MKIEISAVICTHNREKYIEKSLSSLVRQNLDKDKFEIIVVDNASTDKTRDIVNNYVVEQSNIKYIYEPLLGHSQSRNTGWQNSKGKYVAYLDDDALADVDWLKNILTVFENVKPAPGIVGGKIDPIWESEPPVWLSEKMRRILTILDWSDEPVVLNNTHMWLAGANIAYNKSLFEKYGGFDINLGRKGQNLLSCDETLLNNIIQDAGNNIYYDPGISVQHHIPPERLLKSWHIKRQYWNGVSVAYIDNYYSRNSISNKIHSILKNLYIPIKNGIKIISGTKKCNDRLLEIICDFAYRIGYIRGIFR